MVLGLAACITCVAVVGGVGACAQAADIEPFLGRVRDPALRHALSYGVGLLTETQGAGEQGVVRLLFESGAIQVVVATAACAWGVAPQAHTVVVCGTQAYDGTVGWGGGRMWDG